MKRMTFLLLFLVVLITGCSGRDTANSSDTSGAAGSQEDILVVQQGTGESGQNSEEVTGNIGEENQEESKLNKETEHFRIYCTEKDKDCLEDLGKGLESAYYKVTKDLDCPLDYKVDVTVYPDIKSLQQAVGLGGTGADDYMTAATIGKRMHLVSPLNPGPVRDYDHMVNSSTFHEFTHVVINELTSSDTWPSQVPRWLNEGVASYEGGPPMPVYIMKQQVAARVSAGSVPSFEEMAGYGGEYNAVGGYFFILPAGTFFIEKYGFEKVKQLILSPDRFQDILGKSEQELWEDWLEYLKKNYT